MLVSLILYFFLNYATKVVASSVTSKKTLYIGALVIDIVLKNVF